MQRRRQPGIVLIILILSMILLIGLIAYVLNTGEQVNRRIITQNTADATAIGGATWIARGMNTVAMNNVTIARYIAMTAVLDAIPQATEYAYEEELALIQRLDQALASEMQVVDASAVDRFRQLRDELQTEVDNMQPIYNEFCPDANGNVAFDVKQYTYWQVPGSGERGRLWQAMTALDRVSQSTMKSLGETAQMTAIKTGNANQIGPPGGNTMMFPLTPTLPWQRGTFDDFERPVLYGLLPPQTDDKLSRRGPFDTAFGWRQAIYTTQRFGGQRVLVPGQTRRTDGRSLRPDRSSGGDRWVTVGATTIHELTGYRTKGTLDWLKARFTRWTSRSHWSNPNNSGRVENENPGLPHSRLSGSSRIIYWDTNTDAPRTTNANLLHFLADSKMRYLWPGTSGVQRYILKPRLITDYATAKRLGAEQQLDINGRKPSWIIETIYFVYSISDDTTGDHTPRISRHNGWYDIGHLAEQAAERAAENGETCSISHVDGTAVWVDEYDLYVDEQLSGRSQDIYVFAGVYIYEDGNPWPRQLTVFEDNVAGITTPDTDVFDGSRELEGNLTATWSSAICRFTGGANANYGRVLGHYNPDTPIESRRWRNNLGSGEYHYQQSSRLYRFPGRMANAADGPWPAKPNAGDRYILYHPACSSVESTGGSRLVGQLGLSPIDGYYNGRTLTFIGGKLDGETATVTSYNGRTRQLTLAGLAGVPAIGDLFIIDGPDNQWQPISSPYEGFNANAPETPAPIDLVHSELPPPSDLLNVPETHRTYLHYLGMARRRDAPVLMTDWFASRNPANNNYALAQAHIFNNHSWDLWTPMWHAQLTRISHMNQWATLAENNAANVPEVDGLSAEEAAKFSEYLKAVAPLGDQIVSH